MRSATLTSAQDMPLRSPSLVHSDDDALQSAVHGGPFRALTRGEEREEDPILAPHGDHSFLHALDDPRSLSLPTKRKHTGEWADRDVEDLRSPLRTKGDPLRRAADPITLGLITKDEGKQLFNSCAATLPRADAHSFFKAAYPFTPVLDPERDTWER